MTYIITYDLCYNSKVTKTKTLPIFSQKNQVILFFFFCISVSIKNQTFQRYNGKFYYKIKLKIFRNRYIPKLFRILHLNKGHLSFGTVLFLIHFVGNMTSRGGQKLESLYTQKSGTTSTLLSSVKLTMQNLEDICTFIIIIYIFYINYAHG